MGLLADIKGTTSPTFDLNIIKFNLVPEEGAFIEGTLYWDAVWKTLSLGSGTSTTLQIGQEDWRRVTNNSGKSISDGVPVYVDGVDIGLPTIKRAKADTDSTAFVLGLTTETIANGADGMVTIRGNVNGLDTQKIDSAYLKVQGILFHSKIGGTTGNSYTVTIIDTPAAGLHYHGAGNDIEIDLGGTTSSSAQVVALFTSTPSAIVNVREITATTPIVIMAQTSLANGIVIAEGAVLYLSSAIDGVLTTVVPDAPGLEIRIGRLMIINSLPATDGRVNVRIQQAYRLSDLVDVNISSPAVDEVLGWDGDNWVNRSGITVSGAMGVEFFADDTSILAATPTLATNRRKVESLVKTPTAISQQVEGWTTTSALVFGEGYLYNAAITRDKLDAGVWNFDIYCSTSSINSSPQLDQNIYRVIQGVGTLSTARTSTTLQATAASGTPFISGDGTADLSTCSYLQTPKGLFEITVGAVGADAKRATAVCLEAYGADETNIPAGDWKVWRKLFGVNTGNITSITPAYSLISKQSVQPEHALTADLSDRLGSIMFARSTNTGRVITYVHNGANYASHFQTPLITLHNNLAGLNLGDYQHLSAAQKTVATQAATASVNGYATSTQINKLDGIEASADVTDAGNVGSSIHGSSPKTTMADADKVAIIDTEASNALKTLSWAYVKSILKTYFDGLYNNYTHPNHSGDVTSSGDGATTIAAKAVDIAMLADGTDGQLITWGTDGVATTVAVGTDGYVLKTHGAGAVPTWEEATGGGSGVSKDIHQDSHGFVVGDVLYLNGTTYTKAIADAVATAEVVGIVSAVATGTDDFTLSGGGYVEGLSGLTAGSVYFLSDSSAGAMTATEPTTEGHISKPIFIADSTTSGYFFNMRGAVMGGGTSMTTGLSDAEFCGVTCEGTGGATAIAFGTLCYFKASDSLWYPAKADVTATSGIVKLGICVLAGTSAATRMLLYGNIRANSLFPSFSPLSGQVYVSAASAGEVTSTAPTGTTNFVVRVVGRASTADELFFNPSEDYVELA